MLSGRIVVWLLGGHRAMAGSIDKALSSSLFGEVVGSMFIALKVQMHDCVIINHSHYGAMTLSAVPQIDAMSYKKHILGCIRFAIVSYL